MPDVSGWFVVAVIAGWCVMTLLQAMANVWSLRARDRSDQKLLQDLFEEKDNSAKLSEELIRATQKLRRRGRCYMIYEVTTHEFDGYDEHDVDLQGQDATVTIAFDNQNLTLSQVQDLADEIIGGDTARLVQTESGGVE